ncbi:hypothetical protein Taro_046387, partial [Colocasia esculenta]|nr:hypothetical protein [Colocasia esculenta]
SMWMELAKETSGSVEVEDVFVTPKESYSQQMTEKYAGEEEQS